MKRVYFSKNSPDHLVELLLLTFYLTAYLLFAYGYPTGVVPGILTSVTLTTLPFSLWSWKNI